MKMWVMCNHIISILQFFLAVIDNKEIVRANDHFEAALANVTIVLQQSRDFPLSRPHIASIVNGTLRARYHFQAALVNLSIVLQQSRDMNWPLIASINDGIMCANNHFEAALANASIVLVKARDLFWPHITSINNEIMRANNHFEAALANVSRAQQQRDFLRIWPNIVSINYGIMCANNHFEEALEHFLSVLQQSRDLSQAHIAKKKNVAPSTAKPTESQPKNWASTTTSSYKDVESTSGKNLTTPKTTKSPLCEPASYSEKDAIDYRIAFGIDTSISRHPYQLALEGGGSHICGGSILTEFWALTAAHCVYDKPPKWLAFRAGSSLREEGGTVHPVKYYIYHESYRVKTLDYDVAVVRVKEAFVYDSWTSPVNLNLHPYNGGVMVVATGWGYKQRELLTKSKQLQSADFLTLDSETCRRKYPGQITERMLCAEDPNNITDICSGDSGGALVLRGSNTLVGIVSWSHACGDGLPSVYTNVSSVATWIREQVC